MARKQQMGFDPVLLAVISNRLDAVLREMTNTLLRTGRSALLNTARDFSCSIVTAQNELLAAAQGLPIHIMGSHYLTQAMDEFHPEIHEGDAFLHNDPYHGNTHHADYTILVPVFDGAVHVFTAIAKAHQADCGNGQPTTYASNARDIFEEGALTFPCVKIQENFRDVEDVIRMCRSRIRVPDQWYGDYLATLGAARTGERRLKELLAKYGSEMLGEFSREWYNYSERRMINALRNLPEGRFEGQGKHDPVENMPEGIPLRVRLTIDPAEARIEIDLRDNIDCMPNGLNLSRACAMASVISGLFNSLPERVPHNHGSLRRVTVHLRENCAAGIPRHPASCSVATTNVAERLISITNSVFAQLGDGFGLAEGGVGMGPGMAVVSGVDDRRNDAPYINQLLLNSLGGPGSPHEDGWISFGGPADGGLLHRDSVEIIEQKYPLLIEAAHLLPDSEGAGRFRGAPGCRVVYGPTVRPIRASYATDGFYNPPRGAQGGQSPAPHDAYKLDSSGARIEVPRMGEVELLPGERIVEEGGGGAGYGPPSSRDPERVRCDVEAGLVSAERAQAVYGLAKPP